ncbi:MAG: RidA family protein [Alphaproteobacteria bacterium]|nr:RidA family protein [Alphaproteobacteria bacterium]
MDKEIVRLGKISEAMERGNVPASAVVKAGGFIFVAGLPPVDLQTGTRGIADIAKQTELVLENIKAAVEAAGSTIDKIVKVTIYITNAAYYDTVNRIYARYFTANYPARTFVTVGSWPREFDIEMECIALQ